MSDRPDKEKKIQRIIEAIESGDLDFANGRVLSEEEATRLFGAPDQPANQPRPA